MWSLPGNPQRRAILKSKLVTQAGLLVFTILAGCVESATGPSRKTEFVDDFTSGNAGQWIPDGGAWNVANGQYQGETSAPSACGGFGPNQSVIGDLSARDVDVQLDMTPSPGYVDTGVILRSNGRADQLELNLRAAPWNDLVVQEIVGCTRTFHVPPFTIAVPHESGQTIHVRVTLVGNRLKVWMNDIAFLDSDFPLVGKAGRVGVAVQGRGAFDNVRVRTVESQ